MDLKVSIFNSQNRCKVVVPDELGRKLEHFNWTLFRRLIADSHTNPYSQFANLFTETDKSCKVRINVDSFSVTKIQMELIQSRQTLMPLGQSLFFFFFFDFRSFLSHFSVMKIGLIFSKCRLSLRISIRNFWRWATIYRKGTDADAVSAPNFLKLKAFINSKITGENKFEIPEITQEFQWSKLYQKTAGRQSNGP